MDKVKDKISSGGSGDKAQGGGATGGSGMENTVDKGVNQGESIVEENETGSQAYTS